MPGPGNTIRDVPAGVFWNMFSESGFGLPFRDVRLENSRAGGSGREVPGGESGPGGSGFGVIFRIVPGIWFGNGVSGFRAGVCFPGGAWDGDWKVTGLRAATRTPRTWE